MSTIAQGQSYWKVRFHNGKWLSELDTVTDIRQATKRPADWSYDLVGSGDIRNVAEVWLCSPGGDVCLEISEPYTALQFKRGTKVLFTGQHIMEAQFIGRVDDKLTGRCTLAYWDVKRQRLTEAWMTYVQDVGKWHQDEAYIGPLHLEAVGVRLS